MSRGSYLINSGLIALILAVSQVLSQAMPSNPVLVKCAAWRSETALQGLLGASASQVYVGLSNGALIALDPNGLAVKWRAELGGEISSEVLIVDGDLAIVTSSSSEGSAEQGSSTLRVLSAETGIVSWAAKLPAAEQFYIGRSGTALSVLNSAGTLSIFDLASGRPKGEPVSFGGLRTAAVFANGKGVFGTEKHVIVISAGGEVVFKTPVEHVPTTVGFAQSGNVAVGDERGNLFLLSSEEGNTLWRFKSGAAISSIQGTDDGVFLTSLDNFAYRLSNYNGDVVWKRRLTGRVISTGTFVDGSFAVPVYGENAVFLLDGQKGKVTSVISPSGFEILGRQAVLAHKGSLLLAGQFGIEAFTPNGCPVGSKK